MLKLEDYYFEFTDNYEFENGHSVANDTIIYSFESSDSIVAIRTFYEESDGIRYWNSKVMQETKGRKKHVFNPRIRWILQSCDIAGLSDGVFLDYHSKYDGFLKELFKQSDFSEKLVYNPTKELMKVSPEYGFNVIWDLGDNKYDVITAFEIFDRVYSPRSVLKQIHTSLKDNGLLLITTSSASGFDLRVLQEKSRSIIPPIHLNLFTVEGICNMLESCGFELIEVSSPGSLDVHLVQKALENDPEIEMPDFFRDIMFNRNDFIKRAFQEFLQRSILSSHLRVVAQKKPITDDEE